ncbi:MAG: glycosyltransferase [Gammaproteobacteria bacterium]
MEVATSIRSESLTAGQKIVAMLFVMVALWYLHWRLGTFNPDALTFSAIFYVAEVYGFFTAILHLFMVWRLSVRESLPAPAGCSIDVFVPTYNESVDLLRKTLLAAVNMDYPHKTWLLDDSNRPEMRTLAEELGCEYQSRSDNTFGKAGNLNNALQASNGEFIALFDADHAPKRDFLVNTLGYFSDPNVAFVQTPQDFYNLDSYQHRWNKPGQRLWTEQSLFFRVIQRGKDVWNAAFFCGSCAIIRRASLDTIGGFATGTVTEDLHTSLRLHKQGYRSVYHAESLAFGIAPNNIKDFLRQRVRWGSGAMDVWRRESIVFTRGLTIAQRLCYLASVMTYFDGWQRAVFYLAPAIVLLTGVMPIYNFDWQFLVHFIPFYLMTFWLLEEIWRGYSHIIYIEQYHMARFAAFIWATLGIFWRQKTFHVTDKENSGKQWHSLYITPQYFVAGINLIALPVGIFLLSMDRGLPAFAIVTNLIWATLIIWIAISVLVFTLDKPRRRSEYRFPLPLPAKIAYGDIPGTRYGLVHDISSQGLQLELNGIGAEFADRKVRGTIFLPDGPLEFVADVRRVDRDPDKAQKITLGCSLGWDDDSAEAHKLQLFLYGSDLQWRLFALDEQARTPLQRLTSRLQRGPRPEILSTTDWQTILCRIGDPVEPGEMVGILAHDMDGNAERLVVFSPPPIGGSVMLGDISGRQTRWDRNTITRIQLIESPLSPLYLCELGTSEAMEHAASTDIGVPSYSV